ncbi:MAG TPA: carbohydrate-binding protein, partial [Methylomirabilota bacterium]|nr:carbohydrate-binding protein [Methylomirabilota bacterium]
AITVVNDRDRVRAARARGEFIVQRPVDSQFGPDGCLYLLDYGETWGANKDSRLLKISYQWGNLAPVAVAGADRTAGREPLTVALTSAGSKDHEGDALRFEWSLQPGGRVFSTEPAPKLTLDRPGHYTVALRVTDAHGASATATVPVVVGNTPPEVRFLEPQDGDFFTPGRPVPYRLLIRDAEEGSSADYEELFETRTFVTANWARGDGRAEDVEPGLALMKQSDCFNCHAVDQKIVGPPFLEVAARYRGQAEALEATVGRVIQGSSGVWGDVPMLPHESLHPDQVRMMVRWVFDLKPGQAGANIIRGLIGQLQPPKDDKLRLGLIEASYADGGRPPAGSLSGRTTIRLRSRRLEAEAAEEKHGPKVLGSFLGAIDHGHYARFANLNLADSASVTFRVASAGAGGRIELRAGAPHGSLLAQVEVAPTGGWEKWTTLEAPLAVPKDRGDVVVVFVNPGRGGLMNLDWVQFNPVMAP